MQLNRPLRRSPEPATSSGPRRRSSRPASPVAWWHWCLHSRPVTGAVLTLASGLCLLGLPGGTFTVILLPGLAGTSGFLFGAGLVVLGLFLMLQPRSHAFAGVAAMLVAVTSLVTTNLGGFGVGLALGVVGGALGFAWTPDDARIPDTPEPEPGTRDRSRGGPDEPTRPISSARPAPDARW